MGPAVVVGLLGRDARSGAQQRPHRHVRRHRPDRCWPVHGQGCARAAWALSRADAPCRGWGVWYPFLFFWRRPLAISCSPPDRRLGVLLHGLSVVVEQLALECSEKFVFLSLTLSRWTSEASA